MLRRVAAAGGPCTFSDDTSERSVWRRRGGRGRRLCVIAGRWRARQQLSSVARLRAERQVHHPAPVTAFAREQLGWCVHDVEHDCASSTAATTDPLLLDVRHVPISCVSSLSGSLLHPMKRANMLALIRTLER